MQRRQSLVLISVALATAGPATAAEAPRPEGTAYAIVNVNLIPMDAERVLADQTVLVAEGRIRAVGPARQVPVPQGARRIDAHGGYLIPGLVDSHVHLTSQAELPLYLVNGVTTVYNLNGAPADLLWRTAVAEGRLTGPTIVTTGPIFMRARSAEEAVRLVEQIADAGYDGVKIYNQVSRAEYPALIETAKRRNLLLMGHIAREPGLAMTLAAGQSVAHAEEFVYTAFSPQHDGRLDHMQLDEGRIPALARQAADAGICVTPTLIAFHDILRQATDLDRFLADPRLQHLAPWIQEGLKPGANRYHDRYTPAALKNLTAAYPFQKLLVKAFADAGVPLLAGTDATVIGPLAGFSLHEELGELVGAGLTPYQALAAATRNPAAYFHRAVDSGTIAAGKRADLVLLAANPLEDIQRSREIQGVMAQGRWLDADRLRSLLADVPAAYGREKADLLRILEQDPGAADRYLADHDPEGLMAGSALRDALRQQGPERFWNTIARVRETNPGSLLAGEGSINGLGYALLMSKDLGGAIAVFRRNTADFPRSANARDSLAEAFAKSGDAASAASGYSAALAIDPGYVNAELACSFLREQAPAAQKGAPIPNCPAAR